MVAPPSTTIVWPVMKRPAARGEQHAAPAISSGSPTRPKGVAARRCARTSSFSIARSRNRSDQARRDAVDPDIVPAPFDARGCAPAAYRRLGHRIGAEMGVPRKPASRDDRRSEPSRRAAISGSTSEQSQSWLFTLTAMILSKASSLDLGERPVIGIGARRCSTRMSIWPNAARVLSTSALSCALSPTLQGIATAVPPAARIAAAPRPRRPRPCGSKSPRARRRAPFPRRWRGRCRATSR